jgi:putative intracellular protease/amidase
MWDPVDNPASINLIASSYNAGKPVAVVCHAPTVLHKVTCHGARIVKGKRVTGFANGEEAAVELSNVVTFPVEDELKRLGARYEKAADWESFSIVDGHLITGQNPASSAAAAQALVNLLEEEARNVPLHLN